MANDPLPSFRSIGTQLMSWRLLVNGAAMDASEFEMEIPTVACFKALQSLAPSPTIATCDPSSSRSSMRSALSSGDIPAYTIVLLITYLSVLSKPLLFLLSYKYLSTSPFIAKLYPPPVLLRWFLFKKSSKWSQLYFYNIDLFRGSVSFSVYLYWSFSRSTSNEFWTSN